MFGGLVSAVLVAAATSSLPKYPDFDPPLPYVLVNSTWNTTGFDSTTSVPLPTGQWWQDLADPTSPSPVNALPLLVQRTPCGVSLAPPELENSNLGRRAETPFKPQLEVRTDAISGDDQCLPTVSGWGPFHVEMKHRVTTGLSTGRGVDTILARGSPYASFKPVSGSLVHIKFNDHISKVSDVSITNDRVIHASMVNVTTLGGKAWLITFPFVTTLQVKRNSITLTVSFNAWFSIANVPNLGSATHGAASWYLHDNAKCIGKGGKVNTAYTTFDAEVSYVWDHAETLPCVPLMLTAPHHRTNWKGTWPPHASDHPLQYLTTIGRLIPPPTVVPSFATTYQLGYDDTKLTSGAAPLALCQEYWLHKKLLLDEDYYLTTYKAISDNATTEQNTLYNAAREFYGVAKSYRVARRVSAVKMGQRLQARLITLMEKIAKLAAYDTRWGGMVITPVDRLASEVVTHNYQNHTVVYGQVLYGFSQLYGEPPGGLDKAPPIPGFVGSFINTVLRNVMGPEGSRHFPPTRNFDWYTGLSLKGGFLDAKYGREYEMPSNSLVQWLGARETARLLKLSDAIALASILYGVESQSVKEYWLTTQDGVGVQGAGVTRLAAMIVESGYNLDMIAPLGEHLVSLYSHIAGQASLVQVVRTLEGADPAELRKLETTTFDLAIAGMKNGTQVTRLLEVAIPVKNDVLHGHTTPVEWALYTVGPDMACNDQFPNTWKGQLPLQVVGKQLWYKDSFNYEIKAVNYVPGVIHRDPDQTNVYGNFYDPVFKRDMPRIKSAGFNTLRVRWFDGVNLFDLSDFIKMCATFDMNIIMVFTASREEVLTNRHIAEDRFHTLMKRLAHHPNIVVWALESIALNEITVATAYDHIVLFRQLRRLRDKFDDTLKRPISLSMNYFFFNELVVGGTAPVNIYKEGVELVIMTVLEHNKTQTNLILPKVEHPILINIQSDSYHGIRGIDGLKQDETYQADLLFKSVTEIRTEFYNKHEVAGVMITEWQDQLWRAEESNNDNDCPDPSPGRQSHCAQRVMDFQDGEINVEHQGLNRQTQKWLQYCISPKKAYCAVSRAFTGGCVPHEESCLFIFLEDVWQWFVMIACFIFFIAGVTLCTAKRVMLIRHRKKAETRGAQAGTRWVQPDIAKVSRIIVKRTCTLPHTKGPFQRIAVQADGVSSRDAAPMTGEWEGEVQWADDDEVRDLGVFLKFVALPNNIGYTIQGQDVGNKYKITGTAKEVQSSHLNGNGWPTERKGAKLVAPRFLVEFSAKNMLPDSDEGDEDLEFVGVWEKWESAADEDGDTMVTECIRGGSEDGSPGGFSTGCRVLYDDDGGEVNFFGTFNLAPQKEVDPWSYNRWQMVRMQLERLQMLIYDEMLCQSRWGTSAKYQETDASFEYAVATLHYRYMHSFYGWCRAQKSVGGILDIPDEDQDKRTDEQLMELLALFVLWQLGEQMTIFSGHWLSWNFHYFMKFKKFPPTYVINDGRHFEETALTFDDINESCALMPYYDVPHQCNQSCKEVCSVALEEKGQRVMPKLLLDDGNPDVTETRRYPFFKTFREARKWGVVFFMLHDGFFILHTTVLMFVFWGLIVNFSEETGGRGLQDVVKRSWNVWVHDSSAMHFTVLLLCKIDFWLVLVHEILDLWISSGVIQSPALGVLGTRVCACIGTAMCKCKCCCKGKNKREKDNREISCATFWTNTTCRRIHFKTQLKLRWSGYLAIVLFLSIIGESMFYSDGNVSDTRMIVYVLLRLGTLVLFNISITVWPHSLHGAPLKPRNHPTQARWSTVFISLIFWLLIYLVAGIFQAWLMYRTEGTGFAFCDCDGLSANTELRGSAQFGEDVFDKMWMCGKNEPRCFTAIFFIWISTAVMFAISVHGGFLIAVVFVGGIKHLLMQWQNRKSRNLGHHKMETKFILSAINVKLLTFADPRDNKLAMKVWNRVVQVMHEEDLLTSYESEVLQIATHVVDLQFNVENTFAKERLSGFLEYLQSSTHMQFNDTLGPIPCYPSVSVIVPVYGEPLMAETRQLRLKARGGHQEQSQLHFLVSNYEDEWYNFIERCVNENKLFRHALLEDQIVALLQDRQTLQEEFDYIKKRALKPDQRLREVCGKRVLELFHTRPKLFNEEEFEAIWWWASMRMQTVARTVRGIERNREASRFLLELEAEYTQSTTITQSYIDMIMTDKLQVIVALQKMSNSKWFDANREGLVTTWKRFPKVQIVFDVETGDYRMSPEVYQKTTFMMQDMWDCMEYASCSALWDSATEDWYVNQVIGRRLPLRLNKSNKVKWSISGMLQGKAVNQSHCMPFTKGQVIQTVDCNQDGYFEESLKLRTLLGRFFPKEDRRWSDYKVVGHPEYVITSKSGTVGRYSGYAEYIFNTLFQRVLSVLGARMHYGHPDYFDASWVVTQSSLSKPNPRVNLNEDIFAGYHIKASQEHVIHLDDMKSGKGRETNFDGAMGFENKLGMGAAMQFRSRDAFELSRYSNVLERHSIFFGSIGAYIYLGLIFLLIFLTMILHISLAVAGKTDYELQKGGSPYGSEWMIQMTLIEGFPLLVQLVLDYGIWGFFQWAWDFTGVTWFFVFIFLTKYHAFWASVVSGSGQYIATGRSDPLFRRSFRHMWRLYSHTHFVYGSLLLALVVLYIDIHPRSTWASFVRTIFHWIVSFAWMVTPCLFNPSLTIKGITQDLLRFFMWVWGDAIQKIKENETALGKGLGEDRAAEKKRMTKLFNYLVKKNRDDMEDLGGDGEDTLGATAKSIPGFSRGTAGGRRASGGGLGDADDTSSSESFLALPDAEETRQRDIARLQLQTRSSRVGDMRRSRGGLGVQLSPRGSPRGSPQLSPRLSPRNAKSSPTPLLEESEASSEKVTKARPTLQTRLKKTILDDDVRDDLAGSHELTEDHFIERGVDKNTLDSLHFIFEKLDAREGYTGLISPELAMIGYMRRGLKVSLEDIEEHFNALNVSEVTFEEFCLIYFMIEGTSAQLESYGIEYAMENLPQDKLEKIAKDMQEARRHGDARDTKAEAYIQFAYVLRRSKAFRQVFFHDSTHNLDMLRTESLLHHYKVSVILEHRGNSTTGRFIWQLLTMGCWLFVYFAMWQDVMWEVFYIILALSWDYVICLPNIIPVVILTKVLLHIFILIRIIVMLGTNNVFFPTIFLSFWFVHSVLALKFSFWAAYGPYLLGRETFGPTQIDQQRELSLIMLMKECREQYLFGFSYYIFCRRILAMIIVTFQFLFCILILILGAIIKFVMWLVMNVGEYFARKNATQTTFISSRSKDEEALMTKGLARFDMMVQTEDGAEGKGTHMWGAEAGTQIFLPGDERGLADMPFLRAPGANLPGFDAEEWPADWLKLAFPNNKPALWLPKALAGELPAVEWLKIAYGDDDLPEEWLSFLPDDNGVWPDEAPSGFPIAVTWPPPRVGASGEGELDAEWLKLLIKGDSLDPAYISKALANDLDPAEWLRIARGDDPPADWLSFPPPPGRQWSEQKPPGYPETAPWPPPRPKAPAMGDLPAEWLKRLLRPENEDMLKKVVAGDDEPVDWLNLAADGDLPVEWLGKTPAENGDRWARDAPHNFPAALSWPPPRGAAVPGRSELPLEWLRFAAEKKAPNSLIDRIRTNDVEPVEWLNLAFDDDLPANWMDFAPAPGQTWPEQRPAGYPANAPWPPPDPKATEGDVSLEWLRLAMASDLPDELKVAALDGDLDPAEWLRLARGDEPPPHWFIPDHGDDWQKRRPAGYPQDMPWPPPPVPSAPVRRALAKGEVDPEWLRIAYEADPSPRTLERALQGDLEPAEWLQLACDNPDPSWLFLPEDAPRPANLPVGMPWPVPKKEAAERGVPADWLSFGIKQDVPTALKKRIIDGDMDAIDWLRLAAGDEPDPQWLNVDRNNSFPAKRPEGYPVNAPWPPPKIESEVPADWLAVAMNADVPLATKQRALDGDLDKAEWLHLFNENPEPSWLALPDERPAGFPGTPSWPPPKKTMTELPTDWVKWVVQHPTLSADVKKKAVNGELDPVDWLNLAAGGHPDPSWLSFGPDGAYPAARPANYPADAPWPPPKPQAVPGVPEEWMRLAMHPEVSLYVKKRALHGEVEQIEWLKLARNDDPEAAWLSLDAVPAERPEGFPEQLSWPPPKPAVDDVPLEWLKLAMASDVPDSVKKQAVNGELDAVDWLRIARGADPEPEWLELGPDGNFPAERPATYPRDLPWPPPKVKATADLPAEYLALALAPGVPLDVKERALKGELGPAEWLRLAASSDPEAAQWLSLDDPLAEKPPGFPKNLPWPPPADKSDGVPLAWLKLAMASDAPDDVKELALNGELDAVDWLRIARGADPEPAWLELGPDGNFPAARPATYPRDLPWPPPQARKRASGAGDDLPEETPEEWLQFAMTRGLSAKDKANLLGGNMDAVEWLTLAAGGEPDPSWLSFSPDGAFPDERPSTYPASAPWPPPPPSAGVAPEWLSLAAAADVPMETKKKAIRAELDEAEWLKLATGDEPEEEWLSLGDAAARPATYPADKPWPAPRRAPPKSLHPAIDPEWLTLGFDRPAGMNFCRRVLRRDMTAADWVYTATGKVAPPEWFDADGAPVAARPAEYPENLPWPPPMPEAQKPEREKDLSKEWVQRALQQKTPDSVVQKGMRGELDVSEWLRIALNGAEPQPEWISLGMAGMTQRPPGYPADAPWPPPTKESSAPLSPEAVPASVTAASPKEAVEVRPEWIQFALAQNAPDDVVRRAMKGEVETAEWLRMANNGKEPEAAWMQLGRDGNWPKERPDGYPADAPWPPPRPQKSDYELEPEWLNVAFDADIDGKGVQRAVKGGMEPAEWVQLATGAPAKPEWLKSPEARPEDFPASLPWPLPQVRNAEENKNDVEWVSLAARYGKKALTERVANGDLTSAEWLRLATGRNPPPHWLSLEDPATGNWAARPADYPRDAPWPPPAKRLSEQQLCLEWLKAVLDKGATGRTLQRAHNRELQPSEWIQVATGRADIPAHWLHSRNADGTPAPLPEGFPTGLPWPLPKAPPKPVPAEPEKKRAGVTFMAPGDEAPPEEPNEDALQIEWMTRAFDPKHGFEPKKLQAASRGELPAAEWLSLAAGPGAPIPESWLPADGEAFSAERPDDYPPDMPWPPPKQQTESERKAAKAAKRAGPQSEEPQTVDEQLPAMWLNLALGNAKGNDSDLEVETLKTVLNNDLPPSDWLKLANGGNPIPDAWYDLIPGSGQAWPEFPPHDYPLTSPWPPPRPKSYGFKCEVWEDMTNGGHNDEPEQHYSAAVAVQSDPAEPKKTAAWTNKGLQAFQDQLMGQGPTHHQKAAAAAAAAAAAPEEPPVRASESTLIYFQENAEDGEAKNVNFVDSENFNSIAEFRAGVRHFLKFRGPVDQVLLQIKKRGDFHDLEEVENHHAWPLRTTQQNPVIVTIFDLYKPRQRKQMLKLKTGQLKMGLATDINRRALQVGAAKPESYQKPSVKKLLKQASQRMLEQAAAPPATMPGARTAGQKPAAEGTPEASPAKGTVYDADDTDSESHESFTVDETMDMVIPELGLAIAPSQRVEASFKDQGLKVESASGPAAETGIRSGDVIISINGKPIDSRLDIHKVVKQIRKSGQREPVAVVVNNSSGKSTKLVRPVVTTGPSAPEKAGLQQGFVLPNIAEMQKRMASSKAEGEAAQPERKVSYERRGSMALARPRSSTMAGSLSQRPPGLLPLGDAPRTEGLPPLGASPSSPATRARSHTTTRREGAEGPISPFTPPATSDGPAVTFNE